MLPTYRIFLIVVLYPLLTQGNVNETLYEEEPERVTVRDLSYGGDTSIYGEEEFSGLRGQGLTDDFQAFSLRPEQMTYTISEFPPFLLSLLLAVQVIINLFEYRSLNYHKNI